MGKTKKLIELKQLKEEISRELLGKNIDLHKLKEILHEKSNH